MKTVDQSGQPPLYPLEKAGVDVQNYGHYLKVNEEEPFAVEVRTPRQVPCGGLALPSGGSRLPHGATALKHGGQGRYADDAWMVVAQGGGDFPDGRAAQQFGGCVTVGGQ